MLRESQVVTSALRRAGIFCAVTLAMLAVGGCATYTRPRTQFDALGDPIFFKREAQYEAVDYFHRWRSTAYDRLDKALTYLLSPDEKKVIDDYGQPGYVRRPFRSSVGERVNEWVYLEQNILFQFVEGDLVYSGPVTDIEQTLIRLGYPDSSISIQENQGARVQTYVYGRWGARTDIYHFADGYLVMMVR